MIIQFKNRTKELSEIKEVLESDDFELIIFYGRRRVGKTELILNSTKATNRIYYLAVGENNLKRFYDRCSSQFPEVLKLKQDWEVLFDFLKEKVDVIIIDEFQNLISEDKNILNIYQSIIDSDLKDSKMKLFFLGSSISMIQSNLLSYKSPLYGRRTGSMQIKPVSFFDMNKFFPDKSMGELAKIYGFSDGIPFYLVRIDDEFWKWLSEEIKKQRSFLKDEIDFMLRYEFEDVSTYKLVLEAIANQKTKLSEIKDYIKVKRTDLSPYLSNLIQVGLIKRIVPITENEKSRLGRYYLSDNFLKFWFRFIYPNLSYIEEQSLSINSIKRDYDSYMGFIFENICTQYIKKTRMKKYTKIGNWWHKDNEIDIIALDEDSKKIMFSECKWKDNVDAKKILSELKSKKIHVRWNNETRKEHYIIFAKSFSIKTDEAECIDLDDMKKLMI